MNEMNSITAMNGIIGSGVPCGTNSEKKCRPWRQKPTTRTIENDSSARTPVIAMWLVTVKGCTPRTPSGSMPSRLQKRMNMKSEKT